jgi:DNA-binding transcriptional LysR family regulator
VKVNTVFRANTSEALLQALESGIGIGGMQLPLAANALQSGRLVPVLPAWRLPDRFSMRFTLTPALFRSGSEVLSA